MKFLLPAFFVTFAYSQCVNKEIRYEWDDLPQSEQQRYISTIQQFYSTGQYLPFSQAHASNFPEWHNTAYFLPIHRGFLMKYHEALKKIDPDVLLPYWDSSLDAADISKSPIWQWFQLRDANDCVADSVFQKNELLSYPNQHCLRRGYQKGVFDYQLTPEEIGNLIRNASSYDQFRQTIEYKPHPYVHLGVGGDTTPQDMSTTFSPNDPIFYLHHGWIDKLWSNFQDAKPANKMMFDGKDSKGVAVSASYQVAFTGYSVQQVMDIDQLCYVYAPPGTKFVGKASTPPPTSPPTAPPVTAPPAVQPPAIQPPVAQPPAVQAPVTGSTTPPVVKPPVAGPSLPPFTSQPPVSAPVVAPVSGPIKPPVQPIIPPVIAPAVKPPTPAVPVVPPTTPPKAVQPLAAPYVAPPVVQPPVAVYKYKVKNAPGTPPTTTTIQVFPIYTPPAAPPVIPVVPAHPIVPVITTTTAAVYLKTTSTMAKIYATPPTVPIVPLVKAVTPPVTPPYVAPPTPKKAPGGVYTASVPVPPYMKPGNVTLPIVPPVSAPVSGPTAPVNTYTTGPVGPPVTLPDYNPNYERTPRQDRLLSQPQPKLIPVLPQSALDKLRLSPILAHNLQIYYEKLFAVLQDDLSNGKKVYGPDHTQDGQLTNQDQNVQDAYHEGMKALSQSSSGTSKLEISIFVLSTWLLVFF